MNKIDRTIQFKVEGQKTEYQKLKHNSVINKTS